MVSVPETLQPRHGFYMLGCLCFGLGLVHLRVEARGLESVLESLMITGLSLIVLYTAYTLPDRPISTAGKWRALLYGLVITCSFTVLAFAVWVTWSIDGVNPEFSFLLAFAASLGAAVGTNGGLYAVQSNERLTETQELTKLLRINQRVLRHNLRNDLTVALGHLENVEAASETADVSEDLRAIRDSLDALLETTERTRTIVSIWERTDRVELDLIAVLEHQIDQLRAEHEDLTLTARHPDECWVYAHPALSLAIEEALTNAVEHNPDDVSITVTAGVQGDGTATVAIADTGTGIPKPDREAIRLPEETPLAHTQGLGLWILYWTIQMSDGTVVLDENEPQGTVVRVTLPTSARAS